MWVPLPHSQIFMSFLGHFSCVWLCVTLWTAAHQAPLSMGFSRQEYCSRLPCPPLAALPDLGIEPLSPASPALQVNFSPTEPLNVMIFLPTEPPEVVYQYVSLSCLLCVLHHYDSFTWELRPSQLRGETGIDLVMIKWVDEGWNTT